MATNAFQDITNTKPKNFKLTVHKHAHRQKLLRWLFEVCMDFKYTTYTYITAVLLLDKYTQKAGIVLEEYQLTGIASLLVAAKLEERYPKSVQDYSVITDSSCAPEKIIAKEKEMLEMIDYELDLILPHVYIGEDAFDGLGSLGDDPLAQLESAMAAYLEKNTGCKTARGILDAAKRMLMERGEDKSRSESMQFYLNHIKHCRKREH